MRTYSSADALKRHPEITDRPVSVTALLEHFRPNPPTSAKALLRRMGPFDPAQDGFPFTNNFQLTVANRVELARMFRDEVLEAVTPGIIKRYTQVVSDLSFDIGPGPLEIDVGVPDFVLGEVADRVETELTAQIIDLGIDPFGEGGRCGGMAFAGYDFYLLGWPVGSFGNTPPNEGDLGDYIFARLVDSLELNGKKFLEWLLELYMLPLLNEAANAAFGAAVGSIGGVLGAVIGAFLASEDNIFDLGGPGSLLTWTKEEWTIIKSRLDQQAAWPIGLIYGDTTNPFDQHQVLAIGYTDNGLGRATLQIWNNNELRVPNLIRLDFRGKQLQVSGFNDPHHHSIKGIFAEEYTQSKPPLSLRRS